MDNSAEAAPNSLGLDFEQLSVKDVPEPHADSAPADKKTDTAPVETEPITEEKPTPESTPDDNTTADAEAAPAETAKTEPKEKKKPYVNPERVKTGGAQRDKLSEEELTERMARIREQNEKIKQRRVDVQADEDAFKNTQEAERAKLAKTRKVQETIDRTREQNAQRKMEKVQSREWDSGKSQREWKQPKKADEAGGDTAAPQPSIGIRGIVRGGGRGRGRGAPRGSAGTERREKAAEGTQATPSEPAPAVAS